MFIPCSKAVLVAAAMAVMAAPTLAQDYIQPSGMTQAPPVASGDPVGDLLVERGQTYSRAPDSEQNPDEVRTTSALNAEVAAQAAQADQREAADRAAYDAAQLRYQEQSAAAEADRLRYEAETRAAEDARLRYERDYANWQATVAACKRRDTVRCRAGSTAYPDRPLPPGEPVG